MVPRNLIFCLFFIFLVISSPLSIIKLNKGLVEASSVPLHVSIFMDKSNYCTGEYAQLYYKLSSSDGKNYSLYVDIVVHRQDGRSGYIVSNKLITTGSDYYYTGNTGNDIGMRNVELRIRSNGYSLIGNSKYSYSVSNCNNQNNPISNTPKNVVPSSDNPINNDQNTTIPSPVNVVPSNDNSDKNKDNMKFSSTDSILASVNNSDPSIKSVSIKKIRSYYDLLDSLSLFSAPNAVVDYIFRVVSCLNKKGVYDGIFYSSQKDNYTSFGAIVIVDKKEFSDLTNWASCLGWSLFPFSIVQQTAQVNIYKIEIDERFTAYYLSYVWSGNNVEKNILNTLGGKKVEYKLRKIVIK